jgi:uncharacterized protein
MDRQQSTISADSFYRRVRVGFDERIGTRFDTVVVQPTSLCNLDCTYCYLPGRKKRYELLPMVAQAVADSIAEQARGFVDRPVDVVWHGGEPTALPVERFAERLQAFEGLRRAGVIRHAIQTNATLIDRTWCELFREYGFGVGVSIDGPAAANVNRVGWSRRPVFERIVRGIGLLRRYRIPFSVICVVTRHTITQPGALMAFFERLGCTKVGFNIEELEGVNIREPVHAEAAEMFWRGVVDHYRHTSIGPRVREIDQLANYLAQARNGRKEEWTQAKHDPIPTIAWNGDTVLMSPELLGVEAPEHDDFVVGNVLRQSLPSMLRRAHEFTYVQEFLLGLDECQAKCAFWDFCRGAHAGNRYFEHGTFAATETAHCRNSRQALVKAFATIIEEEE